MRYRRLDRDTDHYLPPADDDAAAELAARAAGLIRTVARWRSMATTPGRGPLCRSGIRTMLEMHGETIAELCRILDLDQAGLYQRFPSVRGPRRRRAGAAPGAAAA